MRRVLFAFALLLAAGSLQAQSPTYKLTWTTADAPALATSFAYALKVGTNPPITITPTCTAAGTGSSCVVPLVQTGSTYTLTAFSGFGQVNATLTGVPPSPPTLSVTVTITVP